MPLYAGKYVICAFLQNMQNMLRSHDRYKPVSLVILINHYPFLLLVGLYDGRSISNENRCY